MQSQIVTTDTSTLFFTSTFTHKEVKYNIEVAELTPTEGEPTGLYKVFQTSEQGETTYTIHPGENAEWVSDDAAAEQDIVYLIGQEIENLSE